MSHGMISSIHGTRVEARTKDGARRRKMVKRQALLTVLDEQEIQREEGMTDPEFIAMVYRELAGPCSIEALNKGLKDQKVMLQLLDPEQLAERDSSSPFSRMMTTMDVPSKQRRLLLRTPPSPQVKMDPISEHSHLCMPTSELPLRRIDMAVI